jgi:hypothetical protein
MVTQHPSGAGVSFKTPRRVYLSILPARPHHPSHPLPHTHGVRALRRVPLLVAPLTVMHRITDHGYCGG